MVAGSYRVEYARSGRATCSVKTCSDAHVLIVKGTLRLGTWLQIDGRGWWTWRHWQVESFSLVIRGSGLHLRGCVTPQQCENIGSSIEEDWEILDGYDELETEDKEKIRRAITAGHVADEDLLPHIDPKLNRAGAKEAAREAKKEAIRDEKLRNKSAEKLARIKERERKKAADKATKEKQKAKNKANRDVLKKEKLAEKEAQKETVKAEKLAKREAQKETLKVEKLEQKEASKKIKKEAEAMEKDLKKQERDKNLRDGSNGAEDRSSHATKKRKRETEGPANVKSEENADGETKSKLEDISLAHDEMDPQKSYAANAMSGGGKIIDLNDETMNSESRKKIKRGTKSATRNTDKPTLRRSSRKART